MDRSELMNFINLHYPPGILDPATPYIYFNTMLSSEAGKYIYKEVEPYFFKHLSISNVDENNVDTANIDAAFSFLEKLIQSEYSKEAKFISYLNGTLKDFKLNQINGNLKVPSSDADWSEFIQTIQNAINKSGTGIQGLKNELTRLKRNHERRDAAMAFANQDIVNAERDQIARMSANMERMTKFLNNVARSQSDIADQIYDSILSKYGKQLITFKDNGEVELDQSKLYVVIQAITAYINKIYVELYYNERSQKFDINKFKEIMNTEAIDEQVLSFIERAKHEALVTDDLMNILHVARSTANKQKASKEYKQLLGIINNSNELNTRGEKIHEFFYQMYTKRQNILSPDAFKITKVSNAWAEVQSTINFMFSSDGNIYSANTGKSGAKPDNIIAFLNIDLSALDPTQLAEYKGAEQEIAQIRKELQQLTENLSSVNDKKYYEKRQEDWNHAVRRIDEILSKLEETYGTISDCFIIEDSTKNYLNLEAGAEYDKESNAFHGGSLGPSLNDQLEKIGALAKTGGISLIDQQWLTNVIINAGPDMIANNQRNKIEQYLALFATILLFDDQMNIAAESMKSINASNTTTTKIHLFSLNNGYYPLSYILRLTYNTLNTGYQRLLQDVNINSGVRAIIEPFVNNPGEEKNHNSSINNWKKTAEIAKNTTKIKLQFMVHFMGTLQTLFPDFN